MRSVLASYRTGRCLRLRFATCTGPSWMPCLFRRRGSKPALGRCSVPREAQVLRGQGRRLVECAIEDRGGQTPHWQRTGSNCLEESAAVPAVGKAASWRSQTRRDPRLVARQKVSRVRRVLVVALPEKLAGQGLTSSGLCARSHRELHAEREGGLVRSRLAERRLLGTIVLTLAPGALPHFCH